MKLVGRGKLFDLGLNPLLSNWIAEIKEANWKVPDEVKTQFPRALQVESNKFLYPVREQKIAIEFLIAFPQGIVLITDILNNDEYEFTK